MSDDPLDEGVGVRVLEGNALEAGEPEGVDPPEMWSRFITRARLVSPSNRAAMRIVVVGTGLAGAGAAASLAELGFDVVAITAHDTPRRAHSVAAQGGINAARARRVDGDSLARFVSDTVKGGDFRARESEAWRLGEESTRVIDHLNALRNDRAFIEVVVDVMRGRADQLHALLIRLVIRLGPFETGQQRVMDVDRFAIQLAAQLG